MKVNRLLSQDIQNVGAAFPKLKYFQTEKIRAMRGDIDICDTNGVYWGTFRVAITIPDNYPFGVPNLIELSEEIPRDEDRHISENGICCVDMSHELLFLAKRKLLLFDFVKEKVYPYLSNQLYFKKEKKFAGDEYPHGFEGVVKFYDKRLRLTNHSIIISLLELLITNSAPQRNDPCPCGRTDENGKALKTKFCHESEINFLKTLGKEKLREDRENFKKLNNN